MVANVKDPYLWIKAVKRENFCQDVCYNTTVCFSLREKSINFKLNFGNNEVEQDSSVQILLLSGRISFTFIAFVICYLTTG